MSDALLAQSWSGEDPAGWWVSEKLEGVRAVWRRGSLLSRGDRALTCPGDLRRALPAGCELDGELWGGRGQFERTLDSALGTSSGSAAWPFGMRFMVFDARKDEDGVSLEHRPFEQRMEAAKRICRDANIGGLVEVIPMQKCRSRKHFDELLEDVGLGGGEGLMLRYPESVYERGRSNSMLKAKLWQDGEALVEGRMPAKGPSSAQCDGLICRTPDGREFLLGSGLSDAQRMEPPAVGTVITYRFSELTASNTPRCPKLVGERADMTWEQCCAAHLPRKACLHTPPSTTGVAMLFGDMLASDGAASAAGAVRMSTGLKRLLSIDDSQDVPSATVGLVARDLLGDASGLLSLPPLAKRSSLPTGVVAEATLASASAATDEQPLCPWGATCYRQNPLHFAEYAHPWRDGEPATSSSSIAVASAGCPAVVVERHAGGGPATVGGLIASSLGSSGAGVVQATTVVASGACEEVSSPCRSGPEMRAAAGGAVAVDDCLAGDADVRVTALRNLLRALACDATHAAAREHFGHMLEMLEAGPGKNAAVAEAAPASGAEAARAPREASATPLAAAFSAAAQPLRPAAVRAAQSVELLSVSESPTLAAAPEDEALTDMLGEGDGLAVQQLKGMGFTAAQAAEALRHSDGVVEHALEWLLERSSVA
mmetsp:Transcript_83539/g.217552  ORF Transcript_83539/g.217552 Transcript_83539/m.217552 type:complete len:656 (-) Transcript_83539:117-2084(-)